MGIIIQIVLLIIGFSMLTKGADWFVDSVSIIAKKLYIPEIIIGLTIVSMGTTAPEAAISISAAIKGTADISIGNVLGSNIINILLILGLTSTIKSMKISPFAVKIELPYVIFIFALIIGLGINGSLGLVDGIILWICFFAYLAYLFIIARREHLQASSPNGDFEVENNRAFASIIFFAVFGMIFIIIGSRISVDAATILATQVGLTERFIGLTIVALGTSLPELVTCITAAVKGNPDIAFGNIIGSCLLNALFVLGTSAIITPVAFSMDLLPDALAALASATLLFILCFRTKKLNRPSGITLLVGYVLYFIFILL